MGDVDNFSMKFRKITHISKIPENWGNFNKSLNLVAHNCASLVAPVFRAQLGAVNNFVCYQPL